MEKVLYTYFCQTMPVVLCARPALVQITKKQQIKAWDKQ